MVRSSLFFGAVLALSLGGAALATSPAQTRGEARLETMLAGRTAGAPVNCINRNSVQATEIIDRTAIVYRTTGGKLYVNRPKFGEQSLNPHDVLVTRSYGSQLCSLDNVKMVDGTSRFSTGSIGLGKFVPYARPPR